MRYLTAVAALGLLLAVTATAEANTIASSTMWFDASTLTESGGVYTGVANMVDEASLGIGDGVSGYDVYARNGANAWFGNDPGTGPVWTSAAVANHDAWPTWNPDTPDWYQYSLDLTATTWAVRNHAGSTAAAPHSTTPKGVPMSGSMDWAAMIASETDVGAYLPGTGTPEIPGGAASQGGGAAYWDMDWSWGSEAVPLQYGTFSVEVVTIGQDDFIKMTPVPEPVTMAGLIFGVGSLVGYVRRRRKA